MSMIPALADVLAERLGRPVEEMKQLLQEGLAEASRRRWRALTPDERAELQDALNRDPEADEELFPPDTIARIPLSLLPFFVRRVREDLAVARSTWLQAFNAYQEISRARTMWYHEKEHLQITAAEKKAALDPRVHEASDRSWALKAKVDAQERVEANLLQELEVRLQLVRAGVLADPEMVRPL